MSVPFLQTLLTSLPGEYAKQIENLCHFDNHKALLDTVICFIAGGECDTNASTAVKQEWSQKQLAARAALSILVGPKDQKRARDDDSVGPENGTKRQKILDPTLTVDDPPVFSLNSISVSSPVRKKVDVTIHKHSIKFINPSSKVIEADVPLSSLRRTFILPTRGKQKPHWTVVILSSDSPERGRITTQTKPQIIFGLDAVASTAMTTTTYSDSSEQPKTSFIGKGSDTLPSLREFLSHAGLTILQPTQEVFRSACPGNTNTNASPDGIPGVEAYRAAKPGTLWFFKEGILFGENKPCEFWAVEDLISRAEGLRILSATGRTCSVILTRSDPVTVEGEDGGEDIGVETEFAMVDGREQEGINQWTRQYQHLFGRKSGSADDITPSVIGGSGTATSYSTAGPATITSIQLLGESDASDNSFDMDSEDDDGGSVTGSDSSDESDGSNVAGSGDNSEGEETDAEEGGGQEHERELKPQHHPLMRPGAMPRMSRAAINAVVDMVNDDLMGNDKSDGEDELLDD